MTALTRLGFVSRDLFCPNSRTTADDFDKEVYTLSAVLNQDMNTVLSWAPSFMYSMRRLHIEKINEDERIARERAVMSR